MMHSETDPVLQSVRVELDARGYDIAIGPGILENAGALIKPVLGLHRAIIVTDENVAGLHLMTLKQRLDAAGIDHSSIVLPAGESTKSFDKLNWLIARLLDHGVERKTTLIALGGGVIGDLAGFAAAILLRGIPFVQIPTSLLAQVDSSVGGKTAINVPAGKNLVGAFYQPVMVLADTAVLDTLPPRELKAGYAEIVKYGALGDREFFEWLEVNGAAVLSGDLDARAEAVARSCRAKAEIVAQDEREGGVRALLNLGHTFGHALESRIGYTDALLHGEAVGIGMVMAFDLSVQMGLCTGQDARRLLTHMQDVGLWTRVAEIGDIDWDVNDLIARMSKDKKVADGKLTFILARGLGDTFITQDVAVDDLRKLLTKAIAA